MQATCPRPFAPTALLKWAAVAVLLLACRFAWADIFVVVNSGSSVGSLNQQEIADLYLGRTHTYPNGIQAKVLDQPNEQPAREQFFRLLLGMRLAQVNAYWARLTFTGRQRSPDVETDDAAVIAAVSRSRQAIGFVASKPSDPGIRVILQIHE